MHNEHLMETFPEHSVQFIVADSPETLNVSGKKKEKKKLN